MRKEIKLPFEGLLHMRRSMSQYNRNIRLIKNIKEKTKAQKKSEGR